MADTESSACATFADENVISLADMRRKLRPPEPGSLAATLKNIEDVFRQREKPNG